MTKHRKDDEIWLNAQNIDTIKSNSQDDLGDSSFRISTPTLKHETTNFIICNH